MNSYFFVSKSNLQAVINPLTVIVLAIDLSFPFSFDSLKINAVRHCDR